MEDKKYQIFISSTYLDLIKERDKIIETVLNLYHLPVGMEMFSAGNDEQWEIIKDTIESSDYYVLIIGHRYGSVTKQGISYTEKEYNYALKLKKPILSFIKDRDVATTPNQRESDNEKTQKLSNFISKVTLNKMCDFWENKDDLSNKVAIALPKSFKRHPQVGWIRGDRALFPKVSEELAELSKKNRELNEELILLRKKISDRKPNFKVSINNNINKYEYLIDTSSDIYLEAFNKIRDDEIPKNLKPYIYEGEIESYNKSLPSKEIIMDYEEKLFFYWELSKKSLISILKFEIKNIGSTIGKEIYVTIDFPNEFNILENKYIEKVKFPEFDLPDHPISIAKERKKKKKD